MASYQSADAFISGLLLNIVQQRITPAGPPVGGVHTEGGQLAALNAVICCSQRLQEDTGQHLHASDC